MSEAVKIDAEPYMRYLKALQSKFIPPTTMGRIIEGEILAVLKGSASRTKMTTRRKAGGKYNPGSKFFVGWVKYNGKKYYCGPTKEGLKSFKYSDGLWNKLQSRLKKVRKRAETRVGLSKAVYYRVARELKIRGYSKGWTDADQITTSYLKSGGMGSAAKNGPIWGTKRVASTNKKLKGKNWSIGFTVRSTNSFNPFTKGQTAIHGAFKARQANFKKATKMGAFKDAKLLSGFYPNIEVKL